MAAPDLVNWQWIGGYGGGYGFSFKESDMKGVPKWVHKELLRLIEEYQLWDSAYEDEYYELTGKVYRYRIVRFTVEQGISAFSIYRRKKTFRGTWKGWSDDLGYDMRDTRRNWEQIGWHQVARSGSSTRSRQSSLQGVPKWVQNALNGLLEEHGNLASRPRNGDYYQLTGKKYSYRIVPICYEAGSGRIDIFRRKLES